MIVPNEVNYSQIQGSIPVGSTSTDVYVQPVNGSSFSAATGGLNIVLELPNSDGFIVSDSINIKYKYTIVSTGECKMRATPVYTPFNRVETFIDGQSRETIQDWNVVCNVQVNSTFDVAQKYGAPSYGWRSDNDNVQNLETLDGRHCEQGESGSFAAPLINNVLSNCQKYVPILAMGTGNRILLTLESVANMFAPAAVAVTADPANGVLASAAIVVPTDFIISDFVLSYTVVKLGPEATNMILSNGPIFIKSQSVVMTSTSLNANTSGTIDLTFNQKMASVKSMFLHCSGTSISGKFDAFNIMGTTGDVQFTLNSKQIPARPLSMAVGNRAQFLTSLKMAVGSIYDKSNSASINTTEFFKDLATGSTIVSPGKFYVAVNTEIIPSNSSLLSGLSTQDTPIGVRLNLPTPLATNVSVGLISFFDVILEIDPVTRSTVVRK